MNLKPEELVKALRCCEDGDCCCCLHNDAQRCQETLLGSAAELVERDQKEIAELRAALEKATEMADALNKKCDLITKKLEQLSDAYPACTL